MSKKVKLHFQKIKLHFQDLGYEGDLGYIEVDFDNLLNLLFEEEIK